MLENDSATCFDHMIEAAKTFPADNKELIFSIFIFMHKPINNYATMLNTLLE